MATVKETASNIVTLEFHQERKDADYGSCLWAVFNFDLNRYALTIMSDCGNYSYGWVPTPKSESFMHLMSRVDKGYLLDKIANRNVISASDTFKAVKSLIKDMEVDPAEKDPYGDPIIDMSDIKDACNQDTEQEIHDTLEEVFRGTPMEDCEDYDIWSCIIKDFSANAWKIAQIFEDYIRPKCQEIDERTAS